MTTEPRTEAGRALLTELSESPLPGARYAHDVVGRRLAAIEEEAADEPARETDAAMNYGQGFAAGRAAALGPDSELRTAAERAYDVLSRLDSQAADGGGYRKQVYVTVETWRLVVQPGIAALRAALQDGPSPDTGLGHAREITARLAMVNHIAGEEMDCTGDDGEPWCDACWQSAEEFIAPDASFAFAVEAREHLARLTHPAEAEEKPDAV